MLNIQCFVASAALVVGTLPLASQSAAAPVPTQMQVSRAFVFPTPPVELVLGGGADYSLADLVNDFSRATGEHILFSGGTRDLLASTRPALNGPLVVEPGDIYSVVQDILSFNRYAMSNVRRREPRMLSITSFDSPTRSMLKVGAMYVPRKNLHEFAMDSAFMVTTVITLPNVDVRQAGNALRRIIMDSNLTQIIPIGESNQFVLTGFASRVHGIVQMLRSLNEGAALTQESKPGSQQQQQQGAIRPEPGAGK